MKYSTIIYEKKDRIARITLNRPEALNALNITLRQELTLALNDIEKDDEIDVFILTGAGRAFCAGVDLKELQQSGFVITDLIEETAQIFQRIRDLPIPTICAVNGYAVTGGLELVLAFDIIVASDNVMFSDTHCRVGIIPGGGVTQILPRRIGPNKAKELSFTGNYLSAQEAWQFGLVNHVVPHDNLQAAVEKLAQDILSCDQPTVRNIKYLINEGMKTTFEVGMMLEALATMHQKPKLRPEEAEQRRKQVLERGRIQAKKRTDS